MNIISSMLSFLLDRTSEARFKQMNLELNHPVGSYFITKLPREQCDPNVLFGGTWVLDLQGRFLVGAGSSGSGDTGFTASLNGTGGEAKHKLTGAESGVNTHTHPLHKQGYYAVGVTSTKESLYGERSSALTGSGRKYPYIDDKETYTRIFNAQNPTTKSATNSHNNLPPYAAKNIWVRTA